VTRYLEANADLGHADAVILGIPWEGGVSWRPGPAAAPNEIRVASDSIESWSPATQKDLEDIALHDAGDVELTGLAAAEAIEAIAGAAQRIAGEGKLFVSLGGDHSVSIGTTRGIKRILPELTHLVFDAHMDLRERYDGSDLSHACGTRHMALAGTTAVLGVRSGAREEWQDAHKLLRWHGEDLVLPPDARAAFEGRPVFVSLDLDVLDPSIFPGTGNPEPGGPTYRELRAALLGLRDLNVVGVDLVETNPGLDPTGVSAVVAAELCRDLVLAFTR
jgi:agmatinase